MCWLNKKSSSLALVPFPVARLIKPNEVNIRSRSGHFEKEKAMTFENPAPEITEINNVHLGPFSADLVSKYNVQLQAKLLTFPGNFSILQLETPLRCYFLNRPLNAHRCDVKETPRKSKVT